MRLLVIEDNRILCKSISSNLKDEGYDVDYCFDGAIGLDYAMYHSYDLILLDRMLPSLDGTSLLKEIRSKGIATPVIMVTALDAIDDKVTGLDAGADDYLTKPFSMQELLARIRALSRRPVQLKDIDILKYSDIKYDRFQALLIGPENTCSLSKRESALIEVFLQNPNVLLPRDFIYYKVWGPDSLVQDGNIDNYIRFLRRRLETVGSQLNIKTSRGVGYILEDSNAAEA